MIDGSHPQSLLYVSHSCLVRPRDDLEIARIIEVSRERNRALDVTGALIATYRFFAQILEGPDAALDELMASIARDWRHREVTVVRREALSARRFDGWSMAYSGAAGYVDRDIAPLFTRSGLGSLPDTDRLIRLLREFVRSPL
ncbi:MULTISPECIES: BLUF domain-containing protein [unclassified Sphingomonas]|uniref:BLUF domain-containing protein n=1 Tax=unclassified Sphingomonas TaxID=196159 RepID=UPI0006FA95FE|nr:MULTISPECIES: BLUF domain-containing protein [unclassified Sphingomonas]KQX23291.1 hypothetical protein ASD17_02955 [Sphingomonas sp. Root1294]KQY68139.1 hypothetical protein ASD39_05475 [Sphingomonas sp. Root50]KRB91032.1 hypothetical protein ASE22_12270 [Sphingomonas sp. Root720]